MQVWVLGTLEVSHDAGAVDVRGRSPRHLLALLAMSVGREVSTDELVDGLWGESAPSAALTTLQSHIERLRRDLPGPAVRAGRRGYLLDLAEDGVDSFRFERGVARGAELLAAGRTDDASAALTSALALWRGTPYAEFADCEVLEAESLRLASLRLDALEQRISADLGRPGAAPPVAELEALVRWHPMRESFWALLMAAQYRAGRQADALASYQHARAALADQLGVEPGPALRELERLVLTRDPSLETVRVSAFLPARHGPTAYPEPVALVERAHLLESLTGLHDEANAGSGRLALVHGEAGAGKSSLVRAWRHGLEGGTRVLVGACDPLSSPRPLGPLLDIAPQLDPTVGDLLRSGERDGLFEAALAALESAAPVVVVIEDLHWADSSTIDLVRFLSRRLDGTRVLVVGTYRDDHLLPDDPLRVMVGDITSSPVVRRLLVPPLSRAAVAALVGDSGLDVDAIVAETGGNAFFVSEVIASGGTSLPSTVQDAVLARVHRLSPAARLALESAAVVGSRIEPSLVLGLPDVDVASIDECVSAGMLRFEAPTYCFRHEIVRQSVLTAITPGRLGALNWQVLDRLRSLPLVPRPLVRLAEHAEGAGDGLAVLEFAVAAGDSAASLGSHREAAHQYGRAMPYLGLLDEDSRIEVLGKRARECSVADQHQASIDAWSRQAELLRGTGRDLELADALLGIDESLYTIGDASRGTAIVDEVVDLLEGTGPSRQLALALNRRGNKLSLASDYAPAIPWYVRALDMAGEVGAEDVVARCLANLAFCHFMLGDRETGRADAEASLTRARDAGLVAMTGRLYQTVAALAWMDLDLEDGLATYEQAARFTADHDLHGDLLCILASTISLKLDLGRWDEVLEESHDLLYVRNTGRASRVEPLAALALVGARRGDRDDVWTLLDEARRLVEKSPTLDYQGFIALCRAEVHWLEGNDDAARDELAPWLAEAIRVREADWLPRMAMLGWRLSLLDDPPEGLREPEASAILGRHRAASERWTRLGMPYHAATALLDSDGEIDLREARALFERLGATVLVVRCDERLRSIGAKVPRGVRASTRANVGGLTDREVEVLDLLDEGLRNAEIAARLHLSEKTVGHHVSAILAKLGASSRTEAVHRARELSAAV